MFGFFRRTFRSLNIEPDVHADDRRLVSVDDCEWFGSLSQKDVQKLLKTDDVFRTAAYLKAKEEGLSADEAAAKVHKVFPTFYFAVSSRESSGLMGENARLPFCVKDRINRMAADGQIDREAILTFSSMNSYLRSML